MLLSSDHSLNLDSATKPEAIVEALKVENHQRISEVQILSLFEMSFNQILASRELISLVFYHLTPPDLDGEPPSAFLNFAQSYERKVCVRALSAVARTCKALSDPALTVLWRRVNNIDHLFRILPGWTDIGGRGYNKALIVSGTITPAIWARFRRYAPLVKVVNQRSWAWVHPYTWTLLSPWCRGEPLLPNVETFRILPICAHSPGATLFLSPTLRHLSVTLSDAPELEDVHVGAMLIRQIVLTIPGLQTLHVESKMEAASPILVDIFQCLSDLRSLSLADMYIGRSEMDVLAALPRLESLSVMVMLPRSDQRPDSDDEGEDAEAGVVNGDEDEVDEEDGKEEGTEDGEDEDDEDMDDEDSIDEETRAVSRGNRHVAPVAFYALRQLTLRGSPCKQDLLLRYRPPRLEGLSLEITGRASFKEVRDIIAYNARNVPATLSTFSLKTGRTWTEMEPLLLIDLIKPLLALSDIQTMCLEFRDVPGVNDADIATMTGAWPRLTSFRLPISGFTQDPPRTRPTQQALAHVAIACPDLRELELPELEFSRLPLCVPATNHGLRTLSFDIAAGPNDRPSEGHGKFAGAFEVAMAVDLLFPNLAVRMHDHPTPVLPDEEHRGFLYRAPPPRKISAWYKVRPYIHAAQLGRKRGKTLQNPAPYRSRISMLWTC
ncbi:hypothetical protein VTO73DRAFT_2128 [Trametes versicolor]